MTLPTDVAPGYPGHATLHNDVNAAVNALTADTGWRNLTAVVGITPIGSYPALLARRVGARVDLAVDPVAAYYGAPTWASLFLSYDLTPYFGGPLLNCPVGWPAIQDDGSNVGVLAVSGGNLNPAGLADGDATWFTGSFSYVTDAPFPTGTAPGTPYTP